jgi:hypothetical protein
MLAAATLTAAAAAFAGPAGAAVGGHRQYPGFPGARHAVFVQTDNTAGNQVVAYHRAPDGTLRPAASYSTGGLGGQLSGVGRPELPSVRAPRRHAQVAHSVKQHRCVMLSKLPSAKTCLATWIADIVLGQLA